MSANAPAAEPAGPARQPGPAARFFAAADAYERRQDDARHAAEAARLRELERDADPDEQSRWGALIGDPRFRALGDWSGREAFVAGYLRGAGRLEPAGRAHTTHRSSWLPDRCGVCRHSFREGDPVMLLREPGRPVRAVHDSPALPCHQTLTGEPTAAQPTGSEARRRFRKALAEMFPPPDGARTLHVRAGDFGADQLTHHSRQVCEGCAKTIRFGDIVVRCPCGLPRARCEIVLHHDPGRDLMCYASLPDFPRRCPNPASAELRAREQP